MIDVPSMGMGGEEERERERGREIKDKGDVALAFP